MDEELGLLKVVHDEEERECELFGRGNKVEEYVAC